MKRTLSSFIFLFFLLALSACGRLDTIPYQPPQTPETWLQIQPFAKINLGTQTIIFVQPSTSIIVYLLGLLTIGVGVYFLRIRGNQRSRLWWGIALLLWGLGALLAGTSYEAFSYDIKCVGRDLCVWTSWWEIAYLLVSVWSMDAIVVAVAYASTTRKLRRGALSYALVNAVLYTILVLVGTFVPVKFLISFEFLLLVSVPGFLAFFAINGYRYLKQKGSLDLALLKTWLALGLIIAAYFLYYISGLTSSLWKRGFWFSENDVLHIGLILWILYIAFSVAPKTRDLA